jgi:hypothetical protein
MLNIKKYREICGISQSAPMHKALYFGILPIYRAFLRLLCAIFLYYVKNF